ncbi:MAG: flagellar hook-basal body complex protein [Planctomycetes bacterium]|nr:flagellar hook-basal body complex protein [Planctomycetota bacterium]
MSFALSTGVSGLQAHQKMLDIAGNNLANVNATAFKASRITFSELLSETIKKASQPTSGVGGTNPQQMGSGVGVSGISPLMTQGNIVSTGNPLDMAVEGEGYFVLSDGSQDIYTRAGTFAVDANSNLVEPSTGYIVQRVGATGESDGFQTAGDSNISVPYDVAMAANATTSITVAGNLSSDTVLADIQTNVLRSDITFTTSSGTTASGDTDLDDLDQFTANGGTPTGVITVSGFNHDGTALTDGAGDLDLTITAATDLDALVTHINTVLSDAANDNADGTVDVATLSNGRIVITDGSSGYSRSDIKLTYTAAGNETLTMPGYFEIATVGGEEVKNINITVYDSLGGAHTLSGAFVRTSADNTWDMMLTSISGDINTIDISGLSDRRIRDIEFDATVGSYTGLNATTGDTATFEVTFAHDTANPQTITIDLGTSGQFNGLTQFAGNSTAVAREQDGYEAGSLSSVSVNNAGTLIGAFSNGIKKDIAIMRIALFQNTSGLESVGGGYFIPSANSGEAVATEALTGGAGSIHGGSLEKSNADVATEFVNMIQAQNGFQANARTIRVANEILRELTNLIR